MKKIIALMVTFVMLFTLGACGNQDESATADENTITVTDASGKAYEIPENVTRIVGATPAVTEIIVGLGEGDKLIAVDNYSTDVVGLDAELPTFDTMAPDIELLLSLEPQVLIASSNSQISAEDPYKTLTEHGVTVIYMDNSVSLDGIMKDILFVSEIAGNKEKGQEMTDTVQQKIDDVSAIGKTVTEKKSVYFEISPSPDLTTFGTGNFLDEIVTMIGATNAFGSEEGWIAPNAESIIAANPDVIITNVDYMGDQVSEIKARDGWQGITAIKNDEVYLVEANATSRPTQNIVNAIDQIAAVVYPELYQ